MSNNINIVINNFASKAAAVNGKKAKKPVVLQMDALSQSWVAETIQRLIFDLMRAYDTNYTDELVALISYQTRMDARTIRHLVCERKLPTTAVLERIAHRSNQALLLEAVPASSLHGTDRVCVRVEGVRTVARALNELICRTVRLKDGVRVLHNKAANSQISNALSGKSTSFAATQIILQEYGMQLRLRIVESKTLDFASKDASKKAAKDAD